MVVTKELAVAEASVVTYWCRHWCLQLTVVIVSNRCGCVWERGAGAGGFAILWVPHGLLLAFVSCFGADGVLSVSRKSMQAA